MCELKAFECHTPIGIGFNKDHYESGFIRVSEYKKLKFNIFSDCYLNVKLIASFDGVTYGPCVTIDLSQKRTWKDQAYMISMDYLKIIVSKVSPDAENTELHITVKGYPVGCSCKSEGPSNVVSIGDSKGKEEEPPKRSFVSKVLHRSSNVGSGSNIELPNLVLKDQLFIGGKNKIDLVPAPDRDGQILTYKDGVIKWV